MKSFYIEVEVEVNKLKFGLKFESELQVGEQASRTPAEPYASRAASHASLLEPGEPNFVPI